MSVPLVSANIDMEMLTIVIGALILLIVGFTLIVRYFLERIERKIQEIKEEAKKEALRGQRPVTKGLVAEQLASLLPGWPKDLLVSEARFVGKPIDYLIFRGMNEENISEVVFVEVKTAKKSSLTPNERSLKKVILAAQNGEKGKVRWEEYHFPAAFMPEGAENFEA